MGDSAYLAQTILYLRPQNAETVKVLDLDGNERYRDTVAPPPEQSDIPLDGISKNRSTSRLSPCDARCDIPSREITPGLYDTCPRVLRLGFDSTENPSLRGITFGSKGSGGSDVKLPYYNITGETSGNYFRINYNFNSGALLITAIDKIKVGAVLLQKHQSLLLMHGTNIRCGGVFEFTIEFPDLSNYAEEHERNYLDYAVRLGISDAQYLPTPLDNELLIGREHISKTILGKGAFGEVHKAIRIKDGKAFAIKILRDGGEAEMKEVNIMSRLRHENIIQYEHAFKLLTNQICIVMELAVNDLHTHQEARKNSRGKAYFSLQCIHAIGWQALSALNYLHDQGFSHRDLKPTNILVTKWDAETDTPTIKLTDFGLAGIKSELTTFCGTEGYVAPEIIEVHQRLKEIQKQRDKGMKTDPRSQLLRYDKSVDIWALGKILHDLINDIPSRISVTGGKVILINKEPVLRLIRRMMHESASQRPTAAECLRDPWMGTNSNPAHLSVRKRNRSPSIEQPLRNVIQRTLGRTGSLVANPILEDRNASGQSLRDISAASNLEMEDRSSAGEGLTIPLSEGDIMSVPTNRQDTIQLCDYLITEDRIIPLASVVDHVDLERASPSLQTVTRRLLEALPTEGHNKNVTVAGKSTDVGVVRDQLSQLSIPGIQFEVQPGLQELIIPRLECLNSLQDEQRHAESIIGPSSAPSSAPLERMFTQTAGILSFGSNSSGRSQPSKGVTYPNDLDDILASASFYP